LTKPLLRFPFCIPANAAVGKARNVLAAWEELDFEVGGMQVSSLPVWNGNPQ
jgi:hypothetical protein